MVKFGKTFSEQLTRSSNYRGKVQFRTNFPPMGINKYDLSSREGDFGVLIRSFQWRFLPFAFTGLFFLVLIISRLFILQVLEGNRYLTFSNENRLRHQLITPARGLILDREGRVIVRNTPAFKVIYNGNRQISEENIRKIGLLVGTQGTDIYERINKMGITGASEAVIKRGLTRDEALKIETNSDLEALSLRVEADIVRDYVFGDLLGNTLGYLGEVSEEELSRNTEKFRVGEIIGKSGLEKQYDSFLSGKYGEDIFETNASGKTTTKVASYPEISGNNIRLTFNLDLVRFSEAALKEAVTKSNATGGVVVAQDPRNGQMLLLSSFPSYNPNLFSKGISQVDYSKLINDGGKPLFNRVISGLYPPGSVFKMITATAALEEKVITENTTINDSGSISVAGFTYNDWKPEGHGSVTIREALAQSCDTFFYIVGGGYEGFKGLGPERISSWSRKFLLGSPLGVDLPNEAAGLIGDQKWKREVLDEDWYIGNTFHMAIGQGDLLLTPLQVNSVTASIANGGKIYRPKILQEVISPSGQVLWRFEPELLSRNLFSKKTSEIVKNGLYSVNDIGGTAYPMRGFALKSGGKTGTSEFGTEGKTHAWYTVFAPYDEPEIALTVLLEGGGQGSDDAAPLARKILDEWLKIRLK